MKVLAFDTTGLFVRPCYTEHSLAGVVRLAEEQFTEIRVKIIDSEVYAGLGGIACHFKIFSGISLIRLFLEFQHRSEIQSGPGLHSEGCTFRHHLLS